MTFDLKELFESWGRATKKDYVDQQWFLSKWEVVEGIVWPAEKINAMVQTIAQGLEVKKSDTMADLGCGGGWILRELKPYAGRIIGLDFSQSMLTSAQQLCPNEDFVCGEIGQLPFQNESFDCALSYFVFLNFMDDRFVEQALLDVMRILKKGGRALIGQMPDKACSADYDREKAAYLDYCRKNFKLGNNHREVCHVPPRLFDKGKLEQFLKDRKIECEFRRSFNPFYREGELKTIDWRFDLLLKK